MRRRHERRRRFELLVVASAGVDAGVGSDRLLDLRLDVRTLAGGDVM
jgi:hypothetical protein